MTTRLASPLKFVALAALAVCAASCEDEDNEIYQGNWYNTYRYFPGTPRGGAVCFQIELDDTIRAFVGTGANTNKTEENERYRDFYMATPGNDGLPVWTARYEKLYSSSDTTKAASTAKYTKETATFREAVASMPYHKVAGTTDSICGRNGGVGFSIDGKGFVGLGYDGTNFLNDFWCYDPEENSWSQITDYPGDAVRYAVAFVIDDVAYVGGGEDYDSNLLGDFYKLEKSGDDYVWSTIASIGVPRAQATAFVVDGYGYVFGGINGSVVYAFQRYNPTTNAWEDLRMCKDQSKQSYDDEYGSLAAYGCTSFVVDDNTSYCSKRAFITTGGSAGAGQNTWEYDPYYDYWVQKTSFEGSSRKFAVSFVLEADVDGAGVQEVGFVTTGGSGDMTVTGSGGSFYSDTWLWQPQAPYEQRD